MYHYEYVSREEAASYKAELIEIIHRVQDEVRDKFTFQFRFIGSSSRNMITVDRNTNIGFDFDVNLEVNDDDEEYSPEEIRKTLHQAFARVAGAYGYNKCEDSTRVITIKRVDPWRCRIENSCDFAVVFYGDRIQQYIRFNKESQRYSWEYQSQPYRALEEKAERLRKSGCWQEVRQVYLNKKNTNTDPDKHSRSLYAEAVNECFMRHIK